MHLSSAVVLFALSSATLIAVSKVALVMVETVLQKIGTYSVTAVNPFWSKTAHLITYALSAVNFP